MSRFSVAMTICRKKRGNKHTQIKRDSRFFNPRTLYVPKSNKRKRHLNYCFWWKSCWLEKCFWWKFTPGLSVNEIDNKTGVSLRVDLCCYVEPTLPNSFHLVPMGVENARHSGPVAQSMAFKQQEQWTGFMIPCLDYRIGTVDGSGIRRSPPGKVLKPCK